MTKEYTVSELFYTQWKDLNDLKHIQAYTLHQHAQSLGIDHKDYGFALIACMRVLRRRPLLVDRLNEKQAVDIFNDLAFLNEPWYYFPELSKYGALLHTRPDEKMARSSFDQFIYADNEFSGFLATDKDHNLFLRRLAVTLYRPEGETIFDKETVEERAAQLGKIKSDEFDALLQLVFYTYGHVRNAVMTRCKTLLPPAPAHDDDVKQKPQRTGAMWYNIKHQAAKTLVFGDFENVGRTNMYYVLDHLEILCKEKEEQRRAKH